MSEGVKYTTELVENLRVMLHSDAWTGFFVPNLTILRESWVQSLVDGSQKRKDQTSDDYIRGCISTVEALLDLPQAVIAEADAQTRQREAAQAEAEQFRLRAELGRP